MVKQLILFRHAKSDWEANWGTDHDRPLARRGVQAAKKMGRFLTASDQLPDLILTSTARRAVNTVELASEAGHWAVPIEQTGSLYATSTAAVIDLLGNLEDAMTSVMLVGHEPIWSDTVSRMIGGGQIRFPTAAMCALKLYCENWQSISPGDAELSWMMKPKLLKS